MAKETTVPAASCSKQTPDGVDALLRQGRALADQNRLDESLARYQRAVQLDPSRAEAHQCLGNILREQGRPEAAIACYQQALRLRPNYPEAYLNWGIAQILLGKPDEAIKLLEQASQLAPGLPDVYNALAAAVSVQEKLDAAISYYRQAIHLKPDYAEAHHNLGLVLLARGEFAQGWPEYEWRWKCKKNQPLPEHWKHRWDGSDLNGRTILLEEEQGLGDTLQFIRYAPLAKSRGGVVIARVSERLIPLLKNSPGIDGLAGKSASLPPFDVYAPLLSLPGILGTTGASIPAEVPYLFPDDELIADWREKVKKLPGFRIGIAWQGNPTFSLDRHRSIPLAFFEPISKVPGVRLISLQRGHGADQLLGSPFPVAAFPRPRDEPAGALVDTPALMRNLDLIITSDTAIAHLAGGLGLPVWVALSTIPDWRWLLGREDCPWYPTMRLFRQSSPGNWREVFERMAGELHRLVSDNSPGRGLKIEVSPGELADRITRLEILSKRTADVRTRHQYSLRLAELIRLGERSLPATPELAALVAELREIHEASWDLQSGCDGSEIAVARPGLQERRRACKQQINQLLGARDLPDDPVDS